MVYTGKEAQINLCVRNLTLAAIKSAQTGDEEAGKDVKLYEEWLNKNGNSAVIEWKEGRVTTVNINGRAIIKEGAYNRK